MRVFLDTEFTGFEAPELLSIGLVSGTGAECYVELADEQLEARCNAFVRARVLSQFGRFPAARVRALSEVALRIGGFLGQFDEPVEICYDSRFDKLLLLAALRSSCATIELANSLCWLNVDLETSVPEAQSAMDAFFTESSYALGLHRHHALVDARALRAAFLAYERR